MHILENSGENGQIPYFEHFWQNDDFWGFLHVFTEKNEKKHKLRLQLCFWTCKTPNVTSEVFWDDLGTLLPQYILKNSILGLSRT